MTDLPTPASTNPPPSAPSRDDKAMIPAFLPPLCQCDLRTRKWNYTGVCSVCGKRMQTEIEMRVTHRQVWDAAFERGVKYARSGAPIEDHTKRMFWNEFVADNTSGEMPSPSSNATANVLGKIREDQAQFAIDVIDSLAKWPSQLSPEINAERSKIEAVYRDLRNEENAHRNARARWLIEYLNSLLASTPAPAPATDAGSCERDELRKFVEKFVALTDAAMEREITPERFQLRLGMLNGEASRLLAVTERPATTPATVAAPSPPPEVAWLPTDEEVRDWITKTVFSPEHQAGVWRCMNWLRQRPAPTPTLNPDTDRLLRSGAVILWKKPPFFCLKKSCREKGRTVTSFRVVQRPNETLLENECEICHEKTYSTVGDAPTPSASPADATNKTDSAAWIDTPFGESLDLLPKLPSGCDLIILCADTPSGHKLSHLRLPHQIYRHTLQESLRQHPRATSFTVMPVRCTEKIEIPLSAAQPAEDADDNKMVPEQDGDAGKKEGLEWQLKNARYAASAWEKESVRFQRERDEARAQLVIANKKSTIIDRLPFCPDHRDKVAGKECRECEVERLKAKVAELEAMTGHQPASERAGLETMYRVMIAKDPNAVIENILYWRDRSDGIYKDRHVQHLTKRIQALAKKVANIRKSACEFKRSEMFHAFDSLRSKASLAATLCPAHRAGKECPGCVNAKLLEACKAIYSSEHRMPAGLWVKLESAIAAAEAAARGEKDANQGEGQTGEVSK